MTKISRSMVRDYDFTLGYAQAYRGINAIPGTPAWEHATESYRDGVKKGADDRLACAARDGQQIVVWLPAYRVAI